MDQKSLAMNKIAMGLNTLEEARRLISELLVNQPAQRAQDKLDRVGLEDLHKRVTQAITALPHSGRDTANSTKGPLD